MYEKLQKQIGYNFKDINHLKKAFIHSSFANESKNKIESNERLEFLGDAVLELCMSIYLYDKFPSWAEGDLTRLRASTVCEGTLAKNARELELGKYMKLSKGEKNTGGFDRDSILSDCFESVIGAIYLDGGIEKAKLFVMKFLGNDVEELKHTYKISDYKSYLQEMIQENSLIPLEYILTRETGPAHNKLFEVEVFHNKKTLGKGVGKTKKEAEQKSALQAIKKLGKI